MAPSEVLTLSALYAAPAAISYHIMWKRPSVWRALLAYILSAIVAAALLGIFLLAFEWLGRPEWADQIFGTAFLGALFSPALGMYLVYAHKRQRKGP